MASLLLLVSIVASLCVTAAAQGDKTLTHRFSILLHDRKLHRRQPVQEEPGRAPRRAPRGGRRQRMVLQRHGWDGGRPCVRPHHVLRGPQRDTVPGVPRRHRHGVPRQPERERGVRRVRAPVLGEALAVTVTIPGMNVT
jgi:hypothetical protein